MTGRWGGRSKKSHTEANSRTTPILTELQKVARKFGRRLQQPVSLIRPLSNIQFVVGTVINTLKIPVAQKIRQKRLPASPPIASAKD